MAGRMARVRAKRLAEEMVARDGPVDPAARAWTLAVARAGRDEMGVALDLRDVVTERRTLAELVELLPEPALVAVLDDVGGQATGVIVLDAALTAGMVEALTTGAVTAAGEGPARRPTRTDGAMLAPVIDHALAGFEAALADGSGVSRGGYRFAALADGARALPLLMEEGSYRLLRADAVLGSGTRDGRLILALPDVAAGPPPRLPVPPDGSFATDLVAQVESAQVRMEAVLLRLNLPLGDMLALAAGQEIALPQADIGRIALEGVDGRRVATGRLGRQGGLRAVRLDPTGTEEPR